MKYIGIIILLVLCLALLLLTGCVTNTITPEIDNGNFGNQEDINTVTPEIVSGNLENQEGINQSSNNSQIVDTGESVIADTEDPEMVYPQQWATGDGTAENPWANGCIQSAYDTVPAGGTIYLKVGYYLLDNALAITKQVNIIGEGMDKTIIKTADADGFYINADYVSVQNLTIDGDAQTDGVEELCPIEIYNCDYALLENIEVKNAGWTGIAIYKVNNSSFQNIHAHDNYAIGLHPGTAAVGRNKNNTYRNIYAWDNGQSGFDEAGNKGDLSQESNNVYDNLQCWNNGEQGIVISHQKGGVLSNSFASENGETGIYIFDVDDFDIYDCSGVLNGYEGLYISNSTNISLTNVIVKNNNNTAEVSGIYVGHSDQIRFTSCQSYDDRDTPLQEYGIMIKNANASIVNYIELTDCKLMPNSIAAIYKGDAAGAVIVITEAMLGRYLTALKEKGILLCTQG